MDNYPAGLSKYDLEHIEGYDEEKEYHEEDFNKYDYDKEQEERYELDASSQATEYEMGWFNEG